LLRTPLPLRRTSIARAANLFLLLALLLKSIIISTNTP